MSLMHISSGRWSASSPKINAWNGSLLHVCEPHYSLDIVPIDFRLLPKLKSPLISRCGVDNSKCNEAAHGHPENSPKGCSKNVEETLEQGWAPKEAPLKEIAPPPTKTNPRSFTRMALKFYYDLMSQPSRALFIFLKANKIPYVDCQVALRKGEQKSDAFVKLNPLKKVPVIDDDGFILTESIAIAGYLCRKYRNSIGSNWYPTNPQKQARVDEFLAWQHLNIRATSGLYFMAKFLIPWKTNSEVDEVKVKKLAKDLDRCLLDFENVWLKGGKPYLCGDLITLADLFGTSEIEQAKMLGYDVVKDKPNLAAWLERVRQSVNPHYDEANKYIYKVAEKFPNGFKLV